MSQQAHRLQFLFFTLLITALSGNSVSPDFPGCPTCDCGEGFPIKYPFWVHNCTQNSRWSCGYYGLRLSCDHYFSPGTFLSLSGNTYAVKHINYSVNTLTVVDIEIMDDISCHWPRQPVKLESLGRLDFSEDTQLGTVVSNCGPSNSSMEAHCRSYFIYSGGVWNETLYKDCKDNFTYPVLSRALKGVGNSDDEKVMLEGFKLVWRPDTACMFCESSGGLCKYWNEYDDYTSAAVQNFTCLCRNGREHPQDCNDYRGSSISTKDKSSSSQFADSSMRNKAIIGTSSVIVTAIVLVLLFVFKKKLSSYLPSLWTKKSKNVKNVEEFLENYGSLAPRRYKYSDIKKMTNSFRDKLGQGGYGGVFKGKLVDGRLVAVKLLSESKGNGDEFINEVASISRTYHVNIMSLLGFCSKGPKRALVYEFMPNGSLEKFIFAKKEGSEHSLGWEKLYQIALGIARGLEYLHRGCCMRILHFDIKPHNILLDQNFCPKISDFGLAKLCPMIQSNVSMIGTRGTVGYIAPEVYCRNIGGVSYKSDVYSYGMMMLEMVGGRKNIDPVVENTSEIYFPHWIYKQLEQQADIGLGQFQEVVEEEIAKKMVLVGLWCIQTDPMLRPSMTRVVEMLEGSIESLQMPPKPFLDSASI